MKAVRFTAKEVAYLRTRLSEPGDCPRERVAVLQKLDAAEAPAAGVSVGPLQDALVAAARGKVVALVGSSGYGRASKQAAAVGATVEDAQAIGAWMARQGWLRGPQTILDVLNKWPQWLAKAKATEPPPSAPAGFGGAGDSGSGSDGKSEGGTAPARQGPPGRLRPGFGR